jgi:hypothetical protein
VVGAARRQAEREHECDEGNPDEGNEGREEHLPKILQKVD